MHDPAGKVLARIKPGHHPTNFAWGDDDWRSLYITNIGSVVRIRGSTSPACRRGNGGNHDRIRKSGGPLKAGPAVLPGMAKPCCSARCRRSASCASIRAPARRMSFAIHRRTNGLAIAADGSGNRRAGSGRRHPFLKDGSTAPTNDLLDGKHHNQPTDVINDSAGRVWVADPVQQHAAMRPAGLSISRPRVGAAPERDGSHAWKLKASHTTQKDRARCCYRRMRKLYVADGDIERGDTCQLFEYAVKPDGNPERVKRWLHSWPWSAASKACASTAKATSSACAGWKKSGGDR